MVGQKVEVRRDVAGAVLGAHVGIAVWSACLFGKIAFFFWQLQVDGSRGVMSVRLV